MKVREEVLRLLMEEGTLSGGKTAEKLGVSRTAVWKAVEELRREGIAIGSVPGGGYRLEDRNRVLSADAVEGDMPEGVGGEEKDALIRQLEDQMLTAAGKMEFEKAAKLRDQLFALRGDKVPERAPVRHRREKMRHH